MIRSVDFPCDRRWVKNPNNNPLATPGERMGAAAQTRLCIGTIGLILSEHFTAPPPMWHAGDGLRYPNTWTVTLTRISMGTLDPITGGASMKAVQDAVATWCGVKNERDPVWRWVEPMRQEKRGKGYFGVRIELEDMAPGEPRRVVLASIERYVEAAKVKLKAAKKAKGATSVKMTGLERDIRRAGRDGHETHRRFEARMREAGKPTANDLRDAAERLGLGKRATDGDDGHVRRNGRLEPVTSSARASAEAAFAKAAPRLAKADEKATADSVEGELRACGVPFKRTGNVLAPVPKAAPVDPDAEAMAAMRVQARSVACPVGACGAAMPSEVRGPAEVVADWTECMTTLGGEPFEYGVHTARARAAGLPPYPAAADLSRLRPMRVERTCDGCDGSGRASFGIGPCDACHGTGKVSAWEWQPREQKRVKGRPLDAGTVIRTLNTSGSLEEAERRLVAHAHRDPGEERPARDLAPCMACGAAIGEPCKTTTPNGTPLGWPTIHGVHVLRAKAAGIAVTDVNPDPAPTNGVRKVVPAATVKAFVRLPWNRPVCSCESLGGDTAACMTDPKPTRDERLDGGTRTHVVYRVPAEHQARFGATITLRRQAYTSEATGECWLYA